MNSFNTSFICFCVFQYPALKLHPSISAPQSPPLSLHPSVSTHQSPPQYLPPAISTPQSPPLNNLHTSISAPQSPSSISTPQSPILYLCPSISPLNIRPSVYAPQSPPLNLRPSISAPQSPPLNLHPQSRLLLQPSTDVWVILDDFTATNDKELSVQKGQQVELLDSAPGGSTEWCVVRVLNGAGAGDGSSCGVQLEGRVPTTAIKQVTTALTVSSSHGSIDNDGKFVSL